MKKLKLVWDADKKPKNLVTSFLDVDFKVSFDLQNFLSFLDYNKYQYELGNVISTKLEVFDFESFKINLKSQEVNSMGIIITYLQLSISSSEGLELFDQYLAIHSDSTLTDSDLSSIVSDLKYLLDNSKLVHSGSTRMIDLFLENLKTYKSNVIEFRKKTA